MCRRLSGPQKKKMPLYLNKCLCNKRWNKGSYNYSALSYNQIHVHEILVLFVKSHKYQIVIFWHSKNNKVLTTGILQIKFCCKYRFTFPSLITMAVFLLIIILTLIICKTLNWSVCMWHNFQPSQKEQFTELLMCTK